MHFMKELLNYFYPPRCPICDDIMEPGIDVCEACRGQVEIASEPVCKRCGKPLRDETREYCADCVKHIHIYRQGKAVFVYKAGIKKSMYRFKYSNRREYAQFYAKTAADMYGEWILRQGIEVIVPIPMYRPKQRKRGYNQAEVFARALAKQLDMPIKTGIVTRVRDTIPQKELNDRQRKQNLKNAFQLGPNIVEYSKILLVDDIYTTGSTIDAVAEMLLSGGASEVFYICISIGEGF